MPTDRKLIRLFISIVLIGIIIASIPPLSAQETTTPTEAETSDQAAANTTDNSIHITNPSDTYTFGAVVTVSGGAPSNVQEVAIYARDQGEFELVELNGQRTLSVTDSQFTVQNVTLSHGQSGGNAILSFPGTYSLGVIDANDADRDDDGVVESSLSETEFAAATSNFSSLRVRSPTLNATFETPADGLPSDEPVLTVNGTAFGPSQQTGVVVVFVDKRGNTHTDHVSVTNTGTFRRETLQVTGLVPGPISAYVMAPGRDGVFGDDYEVQELAETLSAESSIFTQDIPTGDQVRERITTETVDATGSDDLIVSDSLRIVPSEQTNLSAFTPTESIAVTSPSKTYITGDVTRLSGVAPPDTQRIAIYVRDSSGFKLVEVGNQRTVTVTNSQFTVRNVTLSHGQAQGNRLLSYPETYTLGVIDAADADRNGDGAVDSSLPTAAFAETTSNWSSLQVVSPSLAATLQTIQGQIAEPDGQIDVNGTAPGKQSQGLVLAFIDERGTVIAEHISVTSTGTFARENVPLDRLATGNVTGYVISSGRDGVFGWPTSDDEAATEQEVIEALTTEYNIGSGEQVGRRLLSNTVDAPSSDDQGVWMDFQKVPARTQITDSYPVAAPEAEAVEIGETINIKGDTNRDPDSNAIVVELLTATDESVSLSTTDDWGEEGMWSVQVETADLEPGTYLVEAHDGTSTDRTEVELVTQREEPEPRPETREGAAFAVPESLEDEVQEYRETTPEDLNAHTFILATNDDLYVVFTQQEPTKGLASVEGPVRDRDITTKNLTFGVIAGTNVSFETTGTEVSVEEVATNSEGFQLDLVRLNSQYRRVSTLTDPDEGENFTLSTTSGILVDNRRPEESIMENAGSKARQLTQTTSTDQIDSILADPQRTHLHTFSFETNFWTDAKATVDAIVLDPQSAAQEFIDEYDQPEVAHAEAGEPILYVVREDFNPDQIQNVSSLKSQAESLDGEVVELEARLFQEKISVQETLEHSTGCGEELFQTQSVPACINLAQDNLIHAGGAWNTLPQSKGDVLFVLGVSSRHQDSPTEFEQGRYRIEGEVVPTARINESLPDGSVLIIYELEFVGPIDYEAVAREAQQIVETRSSDLSSLLRQQLGEEGIEIPTATATQTVPTVTPEIPVTVTFQRMGHNQADLQSAHISVSEEVQNMEIRAAEIGSLPGGVSHPPGRSIGLFNLSTTASQTAITEASLRVRVSTAAVEEDEQVTVYRYHDNEWQALNTTIVSENNSNIIVETTTQELSLFALASDAEPDDGGETDYGDWPMEETTAQSIDKDGNGEVSLGELRGAVNSWQNDELDLTLSDLRNLVTFWQS